MPAFENNHTELCKRPGEHTEQQDREGQAAIPLARRAPRTDFHGDLDEERKPSGQKHAGLYKHDAMVRYNSHHNKEYSRLYLCT